MEPMNNFITNMGRELGLEKEARNPYLRDAAEVKAEILAEKKARLARLESVREAMRKHVAILADECATLGAEIEEEEENAGL